MRLAILASIAVSQIGFVTGKRAQLQRGALANP